MCAGHCQRKEGLLQSSCLWQVRLLLLAALAGEHILFIGPPGTAKSELGRRLAGLYKGTFFERLLTRFSVPEVRCNSLAHLRTEALKQLTAVFRSGAIHIACIIWCAERGPGSHVDRSMQELFGPLSMRALEEDKYVRQIEGYLPYAKVAFIDEIFKANSAILNTLLTILNERLFDNGSARIKVPLICLVSSLPALSNMQSCLHL